jgi:cysteine desulfurase / selenocysteine lyase
MNTANNVKIRRDFPILNQTIYGNPLVYLDNAATTQKPQTVIAAIKYYYEHDNANIHRGVHTLAKQATFAYEDARNNVQHFINARHNHEIIFVRNATEGINLVASCFGNINIKPNDEIIISTMEHHSNIVPWQIICEKMQAKLIVAPINNNGDILLEKLAELINARTKIIAITHVSNTLGTINPIKAIIDLAHANKVPVLVDGAQATAHLKVDVIELDCDFYVFSGHKVYGPTGIGVLYAKECFLEKFPPYQSGGDMIKKVTFQKTEYADLPQKFEAGTPNIADAVGLSAAINYLTTIGFDYIWQHEQDLLQYATNLLQTVPKLKIIGNAKQKIGVISFIMDGVHPHDVATILDTAGIAVRAGHHCTMPLMDYFGLSGTTRISFGIYNIKSELDALLEALQKVRSIFK